MAGLKQKATSRSDPAVTGNIAARESGIPGTIGDATPWHRIEQLWAERPALIVLVLLLPGLLLRFALAAQDLDTLTVKFIPDDAFYYFKIARNIAAGKGSTFDGLAPTNGYHPLWMALIVPCFWIFKGLTAPVICSLFIASILSAVTAMTIFGILRSLDANPAACALGALTYFYNYMTIQTSLNGMETSATVLTISLSMWLFLTRYPERGAGKATWFGVMLGICMLARTDSVLFVVPQGIAVAVRLIRKRSWRDILVMAAGTLVVVLPWFAWNLLTFKSLVQVSGKALPYYAHRNWHFEHPGTTVFDRVYIDHIKQQMMDWHGFWGLLTGFPFIIYEHWEKTWLFVDALAITVACGAAISAFRSGSGKFWRVVVRLWPLYVFMFASFVIHVGVRWACREWYVAPHAMVVFLWLALVANVLVQRLVKQRRTYTLLLLTALIIPVYLFQLSYRYKKGSYSWQQALIQTTAAERKRFPAGTILGNSDCGYPAYVAEEFTIVNLDGLVNNDAYAAAREGRLAHYIVSAGIQYATVRDYLQKDYFMGENWQRLLEARNGYLVPTAYALRAIPVRGSVR